MNATQQKTHRERGASIVEFAIVLPLFLLLIGGMVDFGRMYYTQVMLTNAAREGARAAMYGGSPTARATTAAAGINAPTVTLLTPPCDPAKPGAGNAQVKVSTVFHYSLLKPAVALFGSNIADPTLTGEATMQCGG